MTPLSYVCGKQRLWALRCGLPVDERGYITSPDDNLFQLQTNLRYGCTILKYYLDKEKGNSPAPYPDTTAHANTLTPLKFFICCIPVGARNKSMIVCRKGAKYAKKSISCFIGTLRSFVSLTSYLESDKVL